MGDNGNNRINMWVVLGGAAIGAAAIYGTILAAQYAEAEEKEQELHAVNGRRQATNADARLRATQQREREEQERARLVQEVKHKRKIAEKKAKKVIVKSVEPEHSNDDGSDSDSSSDEYLSCSGTDESDQETDEKNSEAQEDAVNEKSSFDQELERIDSKIKDKSTHETLLNQLEELNLKYPQNLQITVRLLKVLSTKIGAAEEEGAKRKLMERGINICESLLKKIPDSADMYKWLAKLIGLRIESQPFNVQITDSKLMRENIANAQQITPNDPELEYILGRFMYEIANLNWYLKPLAVSVMDLETCDYNTARTHFIAADAMSNQDWKENCFYIAKCDIDLGNIESAVHWLNKAKESTVFEEDFDKEIDQLLLQYE